MAGKVFLVGAGPGDPGLLTVKALRLLKEADVIVYDALVSKHILKSARENAELIFVGKRGGQASASQSDIEKILLEKAVAGKKVVRLKGGDPFIFGRGGEEALVLSEAGIDWEVVPGITSAIAGPAYAGIPVTQRECTSSVAFITGHEDPEKEETNVDWNKISTGIGTLVFLMGVSRLAKIIEELIKNGRAAHPPCAVIMWGTLPKQKTVAGVLSDIEQKVKAAGLGAPSIFIVGEVVKLREKLNWFEEGPLFGKRVLVTRSREQASILLEKLELLGAEAVEFPTIRIAPPENWAEVDMAISKIHEFNWIVFTSVNGVKIFLERLLELGRDIRELKGLKIAAIGDITRQSLEEKMLKVDLSPPEFVAEALVAEFQKKENIQGQKFLLPRADQARVELVDGLKKLGAEVTQVVLYRTLPDLSAVQTEVVQEILNRQVDWVTFTSSTTVKNFMSSLGESGGRAKKCFKVASIGPITSQTAREFGLEVDLEAKTHTIDGLVEALVQYHAS
jgi:uroporphyrinogen III methyltransferase/synthase